MTNSPTIALRPSIVAILETIRLGASAFGRDITWELNSSGRAFFVWDTPSADPSFTDSPCFASDNIAGASEALARHFAEYL